jgi:hypothetical protein
MKNITKFFAIALVILGFTATTFAQSTASANASAKILAGITLTKTVDLNFGTMTVPTAPTTVTISPLGVLTDGGNITLLSQVPIAAVASYDVTGDNNATYAITLPVSTTIVSGGNNMTVNNFTSSGGLNHILNGSGLETFTVGATLNLLAAQAAGAYIGTYNVTVTYN